MFLNLKGLSVLICEDNFEDVKVLPKLSPLLFPYKQGENRLLYVENTIRRSVICE